MDVALIRELFSHCIEAGRILGVDEDLRASLPTALTEVPPYRIGNSRGTLQEWIEDWERPAPQGHNVSANFPFFPGKHHHPARQSGIGRAYQNWMETHRRRAAVPAGHRVGSPRVGPSRTRRESAAMALETYIASSPAANLHNHAQQSI